ncbi:hypothetical protein J5277_05075 [Rhizobium sp. 16-449-1b]|uniref:hypothetical protein n=1 Tax=Rhizobium sp. 16-449-1b TaxID=2819989 RepID=UPI001AD9642C|nr:hypothetical protein [Rhizobium sp. 16-449-1b]MBO9193477.1 hypothetical protein [Rhizobium sp. 16-449-1b]
MAPYPSLMGYLRKGYTDGVPPETEALLSFLTRSARPSPGLDRFVIDISAAFPLRCGRSMMQKALT